MKQFLFLTVFIFHSALGFNTLPPYLKLCSRSDPDFNACAVKNGREVLPRFIDGDTAFMIPSFNPFKLDQVNLDAGDMVKLYATNFELHGLTTTELKDFNWDFENKIIKMHVYVPVLDFVGTYNMNGRILIMNLKGSGPMNNTHFENDIKITANYSLRKDKKNADHIFIEKVEVIITLEKVIFRFGNLLNNPQISEQMNKFLNENWKTLVEELAPSLKKVFEAVVKSVVNPITAKVPLDNIVKP